MKMPNHLQGLSRDEEKQALLERNQKDIRKNFQCGSVDEQTGTKPEMFSRITWPMDITETQNALELE